MGLSYQSGAGFTTSSRGKRARTNDRTKNPSLFNSIKRSTKMGSKKSSRISKEKKSQKKGVFSSSSALKFNGTKSTSNFGRATKARKLKSQAGSRPLGLRAKAKFSGVSKSRNFGGLKTKKTARGRKEAPKKRVEAETR